MIQVTCAIIVNPLTHQVLATQRSAIMKLPMKFEFPGGKIEPGETASECLVREIKEEIDLTITVLKELPANIHHYSDFSIELIPFVCEILSGKITLKEHHSYRWSDPSDLLALDWAEADIPILKNYLTSL